jgi:hypothetical protein
MEETKLDQLLKLLEKHGKFNSFNEFKNAAINENIAAKQTIQDLKDKLIASESVIHTPGYRETFEFRDMKNKKKIQIRESFDYDLQLIDAIQINIKKNSKVTKKERKKIQPTSVIEFGVQKYQSLMNAENILVYYNTIGAITEKYQREYKTILKNIRSLKQEVLESCHRINPQSTLVILHNLVEIH